MKYIVSMMSLNMNNELVVNSGMGPKRLIKPFSDLEGLKAIKFQFR